MFHELADAVYSINQKSTYALLKTFPSKDSIANAHLTKLTNVFKSIHIIDTVKQKHFFLKYSCHIHWF